MNNNYIPEHASFNDINKLMKEKDKINNKRPNKKIKQIFLIIMIIFFVITFIISLLKIINWNKNNQDTNEIIDSIEEEVLITEVEYNDNTELVNQEVDKTSDYWYYVNFPLIDVDITKLKEKNTDTAGWINVNNTNINYPYVHYKDNDFYFLSFKQKKFRELN